MVVVAIGIMAEMTQDREVGLTRSTEGGSLGRDQKSARIGGREGNKYRRAHHPKKREIEKSWLLSGHLVGLHQLESEIALSGRKRNLLHHQMLEGLS
jgi:hypothetical protein